MGSKVLTVLVCVCANALASLVLFSDGCLLPHPDDLVIYSIFDENGTVVRKTIKEWDRVPRGYGLRAICMNAKRQAFYFYRLCPENGDEWDVPCRISESVFAEGCEIPVIENTTSVAVYDSEKNKLPLLGYGDKVPFGSVVVTTCESGYTLKDRRKTWNITCNRDGKWSRSVENCSKSCHQPLKAPNAEMQCYFNNERISCDGEHVVGTVVRTRCVNLPRFSRNSSYQNITCLNNGEWDRSSFTCVKPINSASRTKN